MPSSRPVAYPDSRYAVPAPPDLSNREERRRLSVGALKAFFSIVKHWQVRDEDARMLLGDISNGSYYQWKQKAGVPRPLEQDRLLRISYLIGIFKALNILYSQRLADQWMQLPNQNPIFEGRTPLEYILKGGSTAMETVRRLLDARRGGQ